MSTEIIVSLVTLCGSALGTFAGIFVNAKLTNYRIEQLEKKVDKHNTVVERMYCVENEICIIDEQMKVANHRIADLEQEGKAHV